MIKNSKRVYAVMDSSKLDTTSKKSVFSSSELSMVLMDDNVTPDALRRYSSAGIQII